MEARTIFRVDDLRPAEAAGARFTLRGEIPIFTAVRMDEIQLCSAAASGDLAALETLLKKGVSPDGRDQRGSTPLFYAAGNGQVEAASRLLAAGADINARNLDGQTALFALGREGTPEMVRWLQEHGALR